MLEQSAVLLRSAPHALVLTVTERLGITSLRSAPHAMSAVSGR
jgi:hypothetical protein